MTIGYPLSICIPAYDRSQCLDELIASIVTAVPPGQPIQICIGDDAAPPATEAVVRRWQAEYPHIAYHRFDENGGIDRNILKSVELASGDYCWLMGDDDKVEPGAIELILAKIREYGRPVALNVNGSMYDKHLKQRVYPHVRRGVRKNALAQDATFVGLEAILYTFGESFGFLGDNVFQRDAWARVVSSTDLSRFDGSNYIQLAVLLLMLRASPKLVYVHDRCVGFRGNNDGFLQALGHVRRLRLDVEGYYRVASGVFSEHDPLYTLWMSRVIAVHIKSRLWTIKRSGDRQAVREAASLARSRFGALPAYWIHLAPLLYVPRWTLLAARGLYHAVRPSTENA